MVQYSRFLVTVRDTLEFAGIYGAGGAGGDHFQLHLKFQGFQDVKDNLRHFLQFSKVFISVFGCVLILALN